MDQLPRRCSPTSTPSGEEGGELIPGLAEDLPTGLRRRQDLQAHAAQGPEVLRRQPVKASDFPSTVERTLKLNWGGKSFVTGYIEGRRAPTTPARPSRSPASRPTTRRARSRSRSTKPYGAFANVLAFPAAGRRPERHAEEEPVERPAARRRAVHDHGRRRRTARSRSSRNPKFDGPRHPGHPGGPRRQDHVQDRLQHADRGRAGAQQPGRRLRRGRHDAAGAAAAGQVAGERSLQAAADPVDVLLLPEHDQAAVQQREGAPGRQLRDRPAGDRRASPAASSSRRATSSRRASSAIPTGDCAYGDLDEPDLAKAKQLVQESGMAGRRSPCGARRAARASEFVDYYTDGAEQDRLQGEAGRSSPTRRTSRRSATRRPSRRPASPTGSRTSRTRRTSTCCWTRNAIQPVNNQNFSKVNDPHIQSELKELNAVPATELDAVAERVGGPRRVRGREGLQSRLRRRSSSRSSSRTRSTSTPRSSTRVPERLVTSLQLK